MMTDSPILIRQARIIDGTGAPWWLGDVLVTRGRIADMGARLETGWGAEVIEAEGRLSGTGLHRYPCP
jgi:N-acyl-D-aspartate/D-glutamate deacylase